LNNVIVLIVLEQLNNVIVLVLKQLDCIIVLVLKQLKCTEEQLNCNSIQTQRRVEIHWQYSNRVEESSSVLSTTKGPKKRLPPIIDTAPLIVFTSRRKTALIVMAMGKV